MNAAAPAAAPASWRKFTAYLALVAVVVVADQLTKQAAYTALWGAAPVEVLPFLRLALVFNRGAAFGFLGDAGGWQHYFLSGLAGVLSVLLAGWLWRAHRRHALLSWGLALVLAGALGNLIDRVSHQFVIDFIVLHYRAWQFPAFNIADSAISIGAAALIIDHLGAARRPGGQRRV